ncbi:MAG: hypothetical protein JXQ23_13445 [Clostridia bacterium]|nr:hypothetical protein [Clostridia bacterium]
MNKVNEYINSIDHEKHRLNEKTKKAIIGKTKRRIRKRKVNVINMIAAVILFMFVFLAFIPDTPVNSFLKQAFSFIPGIGVKAEIEESAITAVLKEKVISEKDNQYVEIYVAYIQGDYLNVRLDTNLFYNQSMTKEEALQKAASEIMEQPLLKVANRTIEPVQIIYSGNLFNISYELEESEKDSEEFTVCFEGSNVMTSFRLEQVSSISNPEEAGYYTVIDDMMFFANMKREQNSCEVIISSIIPDEYKNISFEWSDIENGIFKTPVHIVDEEGNTYYPLELNLDKNKFRNTFYFDVPEDKANLELVIPQFLYDISDVGRKIVRLPYNEDIRILDSVFEMKSHFITLKSISFVAEELKLDISAENRNDNLNTVIRRVLPKFYVKREWLGGYHMISQYITADPWSPDKQQGISYGAYEGMKEKQTIEIVLDAEMAYTGEIRIKLH